MEMLFEENALYLAERYQITTGSRVQIFDSKGSLIVDSGSIADMSVVQSETSQYFADVFSALNSKKDTYMYSEVGGKNFVMYSMPIVIDNKVVGIVRNLYAMSAMDSMIF